MNQKNKITDILSEMVMIKDNSPVKDELIRQKLYVLCLEIYMRSGRDESKKVFNIRVPEKEVISFYDLLDMDQKEISGIFRRDWQGMIFSKVYKDPYYQMLLILICYGLHVKDSSIADQALFLIIVKAWQDNKDKYFPCDLNESIMQEALMRRLTGNVIFRKYKRPYDVFALHHVPMLMRKYGRSLLIDPSKYMNRLLAQVYRRIDQQFKTNSRTNIDTGKKEVISGLVYLYNEALNKGMINMA